MKVSAFVKKKNSFGRKFTSLKAREEFIVNRLDGVKPQPKERIVAGAANAVNNWDRTDSGAKIWSF